MCTFCLDLIHLSLSTLFEDVSHYFSSTRFRSHSHGPEVLYIPEPSSSGHVRRTDLRNIKLKRLVAF